jgi:hypothetical protein
MQIVTNTPDLTALLTRALLRGGHAPEEPRARGEWIRDCAVEILGDYLFRDVTATPAEEGMSDAEVLTARVLSGKTTF